MEGRRAPRRIVAGVDIGNSTTEAVLMDHAFSPSYVSSAMTPTTGVKGTPGNVEGCLRALDLALERGRLERGDLSLVRLNQAAPVVSGLSMDTVSETKVIGSAMIGHNPDTPGGEGLAFGITAPVEALEGNALSGASGPVVALVGRCPFHRAAVLINRAMDRGVQVVAAICRGDDGVLIANRLSRRIPVVDEVAALERIDPGVPCAVEVAPNGESVKTLSNPYGIAGLFGLTPGQTRESIPVARSLAGCRSGVVLRGPGAEVRSHAIPAGTLRLLGASAQVELEVNRGAGAIMEGLGRVSPLLDVRGQPGTNAGALLEGIRRTMSGLTGQREEELRITGLLAADTFSAVEVGGGLAGERAMENVVLLAAMVETSALPMQAIARELELSLDTAVEIAGVEAEMALRGALTTPGAELPLAVLDLGGGSTDAALMDRAGNIAAVHHPGAGEMVTRLIDLELDLEDRDLAEQIKRSPLARAEGLLSLRFEDGSMRFLAEPLPPSFFSATVVAAPEGLLPLGGDRRRTVDRVAGIRRAAKKKVFLPNALRALEAVAPGGDIRAIGSVALVGGSAQDFELADILAQRLFPYRITVGKANLLGFLEPHSAVALGLALRP